MNAFLTLLVLTLFVCAGVALLIPALTVAAALAVMFGCFLLWLLPILLIADSDKTTGGEKLAWILAIIFLSWFAWIFYFLLAPLKPKPSYYY
jgi:hypothetical protein